MFSVLAIDKTTGDEPFQNAFKVNNYVTLVLDSLFHFHEIGDYEMSRRLFQRSLTFKNQLSSVNDSFAFNYAVGNYQYKNSLVDEGFENLFNAVLISRKNLLKSEEAAAEISLGNAHYFMKDISAAIEHYKLAANNSEAKNGTRAAAYHNTGALLFETLDKTDNQRYKDSLEPIISQYLRSAVSLSLRDSNRSRLAATYSVLVPWYGYLKQYDSAYFYANESMVNATISGYPNRVQFAKVNLARVLIWDGQAAKSLPILDSAIVFFDSIKNIEQVIHANRVKVWAYDSLRDYKNAARIAELTYNMIRETFPLRLEKSVGKYKAMYQYNLVELENQTLELDRSKQKMKFNRLIIFTLALVLAMLTGYWFYRNKLKTKKMELQTLELGFKTRLIQTNMEIEEKERKRIARELHDGVGQQISSIKLGLENLDTDQKKTEGSIFELKQMVTDVLHSVRGISHQMMPLALQRFGLVKALEGLVDFMNENGEITFSFENFNSKEIKLSESEEIHLYRMVQELVTNVTKHSKASEAAIQLFIQGNKIHLYVSDNGKGIKYDNDNVGMGLFNLETRAKAINASFNLSSNTGETIAKIIM
ncbi:MAG: hypothetical protein COA58_01235 [Bacteroidetes bacterium]|nr:MAG: hypothetical protein COA58_01235 [Bacteroidota bacterium]